MFVVVPLVDDKKIVVVVVRYDDNNKSIFVDSTTIFVIATATQQWYTDDVEMIIDRRDAETLVVIIATTTQPTSPPVLLPPASHLERTTDFHRFCHQLWDQDKIKTETETVKIVCQNFPLLAAAKWLQRSMRIATRILVLFILCCCWHQNARETETAETNNKTETVKRLSRDETASADVPWLCRYGDDDVRLRPRCCPLMSNVE